MKLLFLTYTLSSQREKMISNVTLFFLIFNTFSSFIKKKNEFPNLVLDLGFLLLQHFPIYKNSYLSLTNKHSARFLKYTYMHTAITICRQDNCAIAQKEKPNNKDINHNNI